MVISRRRRRRRRSREARSFIRVSGSIVREHFWDECLLMGALNSFSKPSLRIDTLLDIE